ncbi:MAG: class I SAM-dependent methyltransferase [Acidimicrobiales bacterium]
MPDPVLPEGNLDRFLGFADLYDASRPSPPVRLGPLLAAYAGVARPDVVDLGSGTGLSTRWAAGWAASVIGVEPNPDMRAQAETRPLPNVRHLAGTSFDTTLPAASADVVLAVQAMHWMEPVATLAEVTRVLRPGGVFAIVDADWPPVTGRVAAELGWAEVHRRIRVFEARLAAGETGETLHRPVHADDPALRDDDLHDPHRNRVMPMGGQSWSKREHLERLRTSGRFAFVRELLFDEPVEFAPDADATAAGERVIALMRSQGSYQQVRRAGITDDDLGMPGFEQAVRDAVLGALSFSWRVRLGVVP